MTSEFTLKIFSNRKSWVFHLETLETKLLPDWKPLMIILCYLHQAQQTNTCSRSTTETREQGVETCSKLEIKKSRRRHWLRSGVLIVNFEHTSHLILVFMYYIIYCWLWILFTGNLRHSTLSSPEQSDVVSLLLLLLTLSISNVHLLFLLLTLSMYLFSWFDLFIFESFLEMNPNSIYL